MRLKLATLTHEEKKAWDFAFAMYAEPTPKRPDSDRDAAELAWRDMQEDFPRLREFDGARP